jgi:hypothetical protein
MQDSIAGHKFCKIMEGYGLVELPNEESQNNSVQKRKPHLKASTGGTKTPAKQCKKVPCIRYMQSAMQSEQQRIWGKAVTGNHFKEQPAGDRLKPAGDCACVSSMRFQRMARSWIEVPPQKDIQRAQPLFTKALWGMLYMLRRPFLSGRPVTSCHAEPQRAD